MLYKLTRNVKNALSSKLDDDLTYLCLLWTSGFTLRLWDVGGMAFGWGLTPWNGCANPHCTMSWASFTLGLKLSLDFLSIIPDMNLQSWVWWTEIVSWWVKNVFFGYSIELAQKWYFEFVKMKRVFQQPEVFLTFSFSCRSFIQFSRKDLLDHWMRIDQAHNIELLLDCQKIRFLPHCFIM